MISCPYCYTINETTTCSKCGKRIRKRDEARGLVHFIWGRVKVHDPEYGTKVKDKIARLAELIDGIRND